MGRRIDPTIRRTWQHRGRPAEQLSLTDGHLERITAGDVRPGDRIARTRTSPISTVRSVGPGDRSAYITFLSGERIRPRKTTKLWRVAS